MSVVLPFGLSWFPSKDDRRYIVVRVADPFNRSKPITNYKKIPIKGDLEWFVSECVSYRDSLGYKLWDDWPDVSRPRKQKVLDNLPKGVSCLLSSCSASNSNGYILITSYWQDYSKPKNKKGQYRQSKKTYRVPLGSPDWYINEKVKEAKDYRESQLKANPKPQK